VDTIESVATASGKWAKFDTAMDGLSAERKAEIQRLISNLSLTPDDPAVIAAALLGHLAKAGETVPQSIREAGTEAADGFKDASRNTLQGLREVISTLSKISPSLRSQIADDIREEAHAVLRDTLDSLAEGSKREIAHAQESALAAAKKQFSDQSAKLLSGMDERLAARESVAFWKGVAYAFMATCGVLLAALAYFLP
jgi:hypothetical protein